MAETTPLNNFKTLDEAIKKTQEYLLNLQNELGYWVGELEADASVSAGYIPLMFFMTGQVDLKKKAKVINYARLKQKEDGSWSTYYGGPGDLNVTIQVYFALRLGGVPDSDPYIQKARTFILSQGGLMKANTITKIWLAVFGQFDYRNVPMIPPEIILLPNWFYFNIYEFASWSRETIMALMVILTLKPICRVPSESNICELFIEPKDQQHNLMSNPGTLFSWNRFFLILDNIFKALEKQPLKPLRKLAMHRVEKWVVDHQEADGSWGGIMLPWVYSLLALKSLGYKLEHPVIKKGLEGIKNFLVEDCQTLRMEPATSPVWDTAWATISLLESGLSNHHPSMIKSARWMLQQEIHTSGDWKIKNINSSAGCWAFEFDNDLYPDVDDTAVIARALLNVNLPENEEPAKIEAAKRGFRWIKQMQSRDGGWAAFDKDNNKQVLASVPFADFMTPLDPTSADVTAHAIELFSRFDRQSHPLKRAIEYLKHIQNPDGSWYGRWGVNYIYGTGLVLTSLRSINENMELEYIKKAAKWLEYHQHTDGGWGETCGTYDNPSVKGEGDSTASQTAWSLMGLMAAHKSSAVINKGIQYLLSTQNEDGSWTEEAYTGTGFPRAFYLRYDLYRIYFPLLALGLYKASQGFNKSDRVI